MKDFNPNTIVILQNTLSPIHIERLKREFFKNKISDEDYPVRIDEKMGILFFYDSYKNDLVEIKFENYLKEILWDITNLIKVEIDLSNTYLSNKEKVKFWTNLLKSFEYIKEVSSEILLLFPVCLKPFEEIENYLKDKYLFSDKSQFEVNSYFTLKPKFTQEDLERIYNFIVEELYLDDEIFEFQDFYSALMYKDSEVSLVFNCSTEILICILNELSELFSDFSRKKVEESGKFRTKGNKVITEVNFNTTLSRIRGDKYKKSKNKIDNIVAFFSKIHNK